MIVAAYVYHCTKDQGKRFQVVRLDATPTRQRSLGPPASHGVVSGPVVDLVGGPGRFHKA